MSNLDSILRSRDIALPTKVRLVKAMGFPVVMYGCESWTVKKAERRRIDALELWCWRRLLRVPWTATRSNQSILKEISPGISLEGMMLKLKLQYFGHLMQRVGFSRQEYWSLSLLQGIFPIQGSNPGLLHCRRILCHLSHQGGPRALLGWLLNRMLRVLIKKERSDSAEGRLPREGRGGGELRAKACLRGSRAGSQESAWEAPLSALRGSTAL